MNIPYNKSQIESFPKGFTPTQFYPNRAQRRNKDFMEAYRKNEESLEKEAIGMWQRQIEESYTNTKGENKNAYQ